MKNKMIIFKGNSLFFKIKKCFYRIKEKLFGSKKYKNEDKSEYCDRNNLGESFKENLRVETDKIELFYEKKDFLKQINGNTELLQMLSIDRLKVLEQYYNDIICQNELKIKKLKA